MGASSGACSPARNRGSCNLASENLMTTGAVRPPDRRLEMTADPVVLNIEWTSRGGPEASWLYRRGQTDYPDYLDRSDVDDDEWAKWHADRVSVDKILARAGMFHGVEASAVRALTRQLQPVDLPRGHTVFAEGEPGDRLFIIISGKVKIGRRSHDGRENLLTIMGPSDMFGELSIFDPGPGRRARPQSPKYVRCRLTATRCAPGSPIGPRSLKNCCGCWRAGCVAPTTASPT